MNLFKIIGISTFLIFSSQSAAEDASGKALLAAECTACHGDERYTSKNRKMKSWKAITVQVNNCNVNLGKNWFEEEVEAVSVYLNDSFYHFKRPVEKTAN